MSFEVYATSRFRRHIRSLPERLSLTKEQARDAVKEILEAINLLKEHGTLPEHYNYSLHKLEREPWVGFFEFHALDDVLVVYADVTSKKIIRLVGIYSHELLATGKLE